MSALADVAVENREEPARKRFPLPLVLIVVALLLTGFGTFCALRAHELRGFDGADNRAQLDSTATSQVTASVTNALNKVFSYSYEHTEVTENAATQVLRGAALDSYHQLFAQVKTLAPQQKLVLTTRVVSSAVQDLNGAHATLLVFLDQSSTRMDTNSTSVAASQLSVTAERQGPDWFITTLTPR